ncbi:hypothetical protein J9097_004330 [Vibrio vulnificus]|nr:hypothetical protein [Vibrio vulnificus]
MRRFLLILAVLSVLSEANASPDNLCKVLEIMDMRVERTYEDALGIKKYGYKESSLHTELLNSHMLHWSQHDKDWHNDINIHTLYTLQGYISAAKELSRMDLIEKRYSKWEKRSTFGSSSICPRSN